jgi:hypothetical protein
LENKLQKFKKPSFYMCRAANGDVPPKATHKTLNSAMTEAIKLAEKYKTSVTVLSSFGRVEIVEGKPKWIDVSPE